MAITLRSTKGSPLTWDEGDDNFREVKKLMDKAYVSVTDYGAVGDGVTNDSVAVLAAEASDYDYINLVNKTVFTTLTEDQITKNYYNGTLLYKESLGATAYVKQQSPLLDSEIQRVRTKSPRLDWANTHVLWLGTSIPHYGGSVDGYPILFGKSLNCTVSNMAWAGSGITYDYTDDPNEIATVKALSMTEDDRQWGLATYGSSSAYDDSFDLVNKASQMTCDYRIQSKFSSGSYDCVMLDHNHNDRIFAPGILNPTKTTITDITIGTTTTITAAGHNLSVGDAVALEVSGIEFLNYAAARVQSVSGNDFVLNIDSSGYFGTFTSGEFVKLDRSTLYGAFNFVIYYIKNCIVRFGNSDCNIVLSGAPNEYTAGRTKPNEVYSSAVYIKQIADKWDLSFFDIGYYYDIKEHDKSTYFPDNYHPTTLYSRQALANYWVEWAQGGAVKTLNENDYLPAGELEEYTNQREGLYSKYINGFGTPNYIVGTFSSLVNDDFTNLDDWTVSGTPSVVSAPWGTGNAVLFDVATNTTETIGQNITLTNATSVQFDVYLPDVIGLTTGLPKTIEIFSIKIQEVGVGNVKTFGVQLIVTETKTSIRGFIFNASGVFTYTKTKQISSETKYTIKAEVIQGTESINGSVLMYVDDEYIDGIYNLDFSTYLTLPKSILLGINANNLGAYEVYIGNILVDAALLHDYSTRFTGTFLSNDDPAKTVTVVNGIIVSAE